MDPPIAIEYYMKGPSFMKTHRIGIGIVIIAVTLHLGVAQSPQPPKSQSTLPPPEPHGIGQLQVTVIPEPRSLKQLTDTSTLIIEGIVGTVMPSRGNRNLIETDSVINITQTLKGSAQGSAIVVSQIGGTLGDLTNKPTQYSLVRQGEQYILCLQMDERTTVPPVVGLKRYTVVGAWSGLMFFGADNLMHTDPAYHDVVRRMYEGTSKASMINLLRQAANQK
jgi:hypothetical protein